MCTQQIEDKQQQQKKRSNQRKIISCDPVVFDKLNKTLYSNEIWFDCGWGPANKYFKMMDSICSYSIPINFVKIEAKTVSIIRCNWM